MPRIRDPCPRNPPPRPVRLLWPAPAALRSTQAASPAGEPARCAALSRNCAELFQRSDAVPIVAKLFEQARLGVLPELRSPAARLCRGAVEVRRGVDLLDRPIR